MFLVFIVMWCRCRGGVAACGPDPRLRFVVGSMIASGQAGETGIGEEPGYQKLSGVSRIVNRGERKRPSQGGSCLEGDGLGSFKLCLF